MIIKATCLTITLLFLAGLVRADHEESTFSGCKFKQENDSFVVTKDCKNLPEEIAAGHFGSRAEKIQIFTGKEDSPYHKMATDLSHLVSCKCTFLKVRESLGSKDNIDKLLDRNINAKLGIVQSDFLESKFDNDAIVHKRIRYIAKLHSEEVHFIAATEGKSNDELSSLTSFVETGKPKDIYLGKPGSGTRFTAIKILEELGVSEKKIDRYKNFSLKYREPDEALRRSNIDAYFMVAGAPSVEIKKLLSMRDGSGGHGKFTLIPILMPESSVYERADIMASDDIGYSDIRDKMLQTVAVDAVLVTYDWKGDDSYEEKGDNAFYQSCNAVEVIYTQLGKHYEQLSLMAKHPMAAKNWQKVDNIQIDKKELNGYRSSCIAR